MMSEMFVADCSDFWMNFLSDYFGAIALDQETEEVIFTRRGYSGWTTEGFPTSAVNRLVLHLRLNEHSSIGLFETSHNIFVKVNSV